MLCSFCKGMPKLIPCLPNNVIDRDPWYIGSDVLVSSLGDVDEVILLNLILIMSLHDTVLDGLAFGGVLVDCP